MNKPYFWTEFVKYDYKDREENSYLPRKSSIAAHDVFNSFKTPWVETILYPELSRSNRQANMSGRAMDAENHWLLLTWVPRPRVSHPRVSRPRVSRPRVSRPRVSRPWVSCLRFSSPRVPRPRVSGLRFSSPRIPRSRVSRPRVPRPSYSLVTARQKEEKYIGFLSTVKKKTQISDLKGIVLTRSYSCKAFQTVNEQEK